MSSEKFSNIPFKVKVGLSSALLLIVFVVTVVHAKIIHDQYSKRNEVNLNKLEEIKRLEAEAQALKSRPKLNLSLNVTLQSITHKYLGTFAKLTTIKDGFEIELKNAPPDAIALWIADIRNSTNFKISDASLNRSNGRLFGTLKLAE